jgi:RHS repeat-associated protein
MGTDLGGAVDIVQTTSYYPFGLVINQMNGNTATGYNKNKYLYNGKELQDDVFAGSSLNWFDYGARFYDPQIGRFITVDPLIEERDWLTPYNYVQNNPLLRIDPDGRSDDIIDIEKSTGKITVTGAAGDDVVRLIDDGKVEASYSYGSNGSFTLENVVEKSNKGTTVTSTESDKAEKFYQFAAGSDVEFAKIDVQSPKGNDISVVATSHSIPNVHTLWITRDYSKRGFTGIKQSHSHSLGESVPSGHYGYEEGNPKSLMPYTVNGNKVKDALNAVQTKSLPGFENIKFEVYNPVNKTKSTYDGIHRAKINIPE